MSVDASLVFFSAGSAWNRAHLAARDALLREDALILLGSHAGNASQYWLESQLFAKNNISFGKNIFPWKEWVKERARSVAINANCSFRILHPLTERELFRETIQALLESQQLPILAPYLGEENFFSALLKNIKELRKAGIKSRENIERAMDLLGGHREQAYQELWILLMAYTARLQSSENGLCDESDLLELAAQGPSLDKPLFLLGFTEASILELDLIQTLARQCRVTVPIDASNEKITAAIKAKELEQLSSSLLFVRSLATNFSGSISFLDESSTRNEEEKVRAFSLLEAHTSLEELRSAAQLTRLLSEEKRNIFIIKAPNSLNSKLAEQEFCDALGFTEAVEERPAIEHRLTALILNALELRKKEYALGPALEFAMLLEMCKKNFSAEDLGLLASRAGIRKGLDNWRKHAKNVAKLASFQTELDLLDGAFPETGSALVFHYALHSYLDKIGIGNLAKGEISLVEERELHIMLSAILRNSANLAAHLQKEYSYGDWLHELRISLSQSLIAKQGDLPENIHFLKIGEWIPPTREIDGLIFLGMNEGIEPRPETAFFLEEGARRRLGDYQLHTRLQLELEILQYFRTASSTNSILLLSRAKSDTNGKELKPTWLLSTLAWKSRAWPNFIGTKIFPNIKPEYDLKLDAYKPVHYSASLIADYKKCSFLAFVNRVLRFEDKIHAPELDIHRLDEGNLAHEALEIFYGNKAGRNISIEAERYQRIEESLDEVMQKADLRYYMGNENLFALQKGKILSTLKLYVQAEAEFFSKNPQLEVLECEWNFLHIVEGRPFKGVIDRIDIDRDNGTFMVVDYKIGGTPSSKEMRELHDFQLYVYLDAAENFVKLEPAAAYYGSLRSQERNQGLIKSKFNLANKNEAKKYFNLNSRTGALVSDDDFNSLRDRARQEMRGILEKMESGSFPVHPLNPKDCESCQIRPACRIRAKNEKNEGEWKKFPREEFLSLLLPIAKPEIKVKKIELKFNDRQEEALQKTGALVFLEASAGTGKTTVLVEKIRRFIRNSIESLGLKPIRAVERFTAVTFSEKSASELSLRLSAVLFEEYGADVAAMAQERVSTVHGFCRKIINEFPLEAGANPLAGMLEEKGALELRASILEDLFLSQKEAVKTALSLLFAVYNRTEIQKMIEQLCSSRALVEEYFLHEASMEDPLLAAIIFLFQEFCKNYDECKWQRSVLDFNDLERLANKALQLPSVQESYRENTDLLLVDEFQDTNSLQRSILQGIARPSWSNLFAVGDAKQSIYRFRDADVSVFQELRKLAKKEGSLYELDTNFRSQAHIVNFASAISKKIFPDPNSDFPAFEATWSEVMAKRPASHTVKIFEYDLPKEFGADDCRAEEANRIVDLVQDLLQKGKKLEDITILFRKLSGNQVYLNTLQSAGIPYRLGSSSTFYRQMVIVDGLALLRTFYTSHNDLALLAVLRSPWFGFEAKKIVEIQSRKGDSLWKKLREEEATLLFHWKRKSTRASLSLVLREAYTQYPLYTSARARLQIDKFLSIIENLELEALSNFELIEMISYWAGWLRESDSAKEQSVAEESGLGAIQVMTIHASKGLEFDTVILPDLDSGSPADRSLIHFLPGIGISLKSPSDSEKNIDSPFKLLSEKNKEREIAESKRLLYVALTRAKNEEYLFLRKTGKSIGWAAWIRELASEEYFEKITHWPFTRKMNMAPEPIPTEKEAFSFAELPSRIFQTSISELAAHQFCPEFHRLKFVQKWDDLVVKFWPLGKRKHRVQAPSSESIELLKILGIEKKERGIALHRVLERVKDPSTAMKEASLWLKEAYLAQGVAASDGLDQLIKFDLDLLSRFLQTSLGQELFSVNIIGYPEIPFVWNLSGIRVNGTIDRLIRHTAEHWTVVDYKSSILEESRERYFFQVSAYVSALRAYLKESGITNPRVDGYLVDLFGADFIPVGVSEDSALRVQKEIFAIQENYLITEKDKNPRSRNIKGSKQCFSCPYLYHCELGLEQLELA